MRRALDGQNKDAGVEEKVCKGTAVVVMTGEGAFANAVEHHLSAGNVRYFSEVADGVAAA